MLSRLHPSEKGYERLLIACIAAYSLVFFAATLWKHLSFDSFAWDLGTFDQILYSSVFAGRPFYYALDLFMNPSGHYFAIHFSPILALLFPLYRVFPGVPLLLAVKSVAVASAAYPLYLITKRLTASPSTAFFLGVSYLLSPAIQGANWFDFQPQCLLPLLVFASFYFLISGAVLPYLAAVSMTLAVEEHAVVIVLTMIAVYAIEVIMRRKSTPMSRRQALLIAATVALSLATLAAGMYFKSAYPPSPPFNDIYDSSEAYSVLGSGGNAFTAPLYAMTHPADMLRAASYDSVLKTLYIVLLFAPLFFTPLLSGAPALGAVLLLPFLLSNYRAYYMIGAHYPFYVMPLMFVSAAHFLRGRGNLAKMIAISTVAFALVFSPISPASTYLNASLSLLWYPDNTMTPATIAEIHAMIASIPADASVLTQNHLFPHVSTRLEAYAVPVVHFDAQQLPAIEEYLRQLIARSEYLLIDSTDGGQLTPTLLRLIKAGTHSAVDSHGAVTLYRRAPRTRAQGRVNV